MLDLSQNAVDNVHVCILWGEPQIMLSHFDGAMPQVIADCIKRYFGPVKLRRAVEAEFVAAEIGHPSLFAILSQMLVDFIFRHAESCISTSL